MNEDQRRPNDHFLARHVFSLACFLLEWSHMHKRMRNEIAESVMVFFYFDELELALTKSMLANAPTNGDLEERHWP
jgi:hypothetical protein